MSPSITETYFHLCSRVHHYILLAEVYVICTQFSAISSSSLLRLYVEKYTFCLFLDQIANHCLLHEGLGMVFKTSVLYIVDIFLNS